jgi:hypothetical protein
LLKISESFGLTIANPVPAQFIKGNSVPHIDKNGDQKFINTYLLYLNDTNNKLITGEEIHTINKGKGFVFSNNTIHGTIGDDNDIRLSIGPFNEFICPVGGQTVYSFYGYYSTNGGEYIPADSITPGGEDTDVTLFDYSYLVNMHDAVVPLGMTFIGWAEPHRQKGLMNIWHIALDNKDKYQNYGIYANGLLVESCSIDILKNKSGLMIKNQI